MSGLQPSPHVEYHLRQYAQAGDVMLDVGCGPALYRHSTPARYIGLDVTTAPYSGAPRDVDVVASAERIPLRAGSIDLLYSKSAFFLIPDPDAALAEFYRVLRPQGRLILFDYNRRTQQQLEVKSNDSYPCWTQWGLKRRVQRAGFTGCRVLPMVGRPTSWLETAVRLPAQELFGTWAVVTGIK